MDAKPEETKAGDPIVELLERHNNAAVEASAGTGKTFRIKNIVLELVKRGTPIQKMLIVTFTEKAAGELRDRIRATLEAAVKGGALTAKETGLVKAAISEFDTASISTIHSFCQSILKEYAFENQMPMTSEVMSGYKSFAEASVREVMRTELVEELSRCGDVEVAMMLLQKTAGKGLDGLVSSMAELVASYRGVDLDAIEDEIDSTVTSVCGDEVAKAIGSCCKNLAAALSASRTNGGKSLFEQAKDAQFSRVETCRFGKFCKLVDDWDEISEDNVRRSAAKILEIFDDGSISTLEGNPPVRRGGDTRLFSNYRDIALRLSELQTSFTEGDFPKKIKSFIFRKALELFKKKVADVGNITFDTMILSLKRAIDDPKLGQGIVDALRRKYSVAIIDEFQDTDAVQWGIFEKVFKGPAWSADDHTDFAERRRLIVVGDPKQSIYAFRSADLETYMKAHGLLCQDSEGYDEVSREQLLSLKYAFRSTQELVKSFDAIFGQDVWFGRSAAANSENGAAASPADDTAGSGGIHYPKVEYPEGDATVSSEGDATGLPAISLIDCLSGEGTGTQDALASLSRQSVALIEKTRWKCVGTKGGKQVVLRNGDYCILVERRRDAKPFIRELRKKGIPYTFYKETGLTSNSVEIEAVSCLLGFLLNPQDSASRNGLLLSDFFVRDIREISSGAGLDDPELGKFLNVARKYTRKQEWEKLFAWLLNGSGLADHCLKTQPGAKRFEAYRQIFDKLLSAQTRRAESLLDFMDIIRNWRSSHDDDIEGDDYRRKDSADDRVQIMTMHASKGLEFPFVIIGSGFSNFIKKNHPVQPYTDKNKGGRRVCAVDWTDAHKTVYREKAIAECKRLYYVALTRAQFKIVAPLKAKEGGASSSQPLNLFLTEAYTAAESDQARVVTKAEIESMEEHQGEEKTDSVTAEAIKDVSNVFSGLYVHKLTVDSFSGLNEHGGDSKDGGDSSSQELVERRKSDPLEPGAKGGTVFHAIMEALCKNQSEPNFNTVGRIKSEEDACRCEPLIALVGKTMNENRLRNRGETENATRDTLAKMAWRVLTTPIELKALGGEKTVVRLGDIPFADRRAEVEFHTREGGESGMLRNADVAAGKSRLKHGFMTGFIDLLFKKDGRYYVLDWKTNMLEDYAPATVEQAMRDAGYMNQFKTYWLAFAKQLEACGIDPDKACGGSVYLFVRGVGPAGGAADGQYSEACDLDAYAKEITEFISPTRNPDGAAAEAAGKGN